MKARLTTLPLRLGDGTLDDVAALPMRPSANMLAHAFPHRLFWQQGGPADEYGKREFSGPTIALPCRVEEKITRMRDWDHRLIPQVSVHLNRDVGARATDRFLLGEGRAVECKGVRLRAGFQTIYLAVERN